MSALDVANVALDGYSALLCVLLAVYVAVADDRKDPVNACFMGVCASNAAMALADVVSWLWEPPLSGARHAMLAVSVVVYWAAPVVLFSCFTGYVVSYLRRLVAMREGYLRRSALLMCVYLVLCAVSTMYPAFWSVTAEAGYVRGPLFMLGQAIPFALHLRNAWIILVHRKYLGGHEMLALLGYIALPFVAEAIQAACFGVALVNTAVALATLLIFMNIQASYRAELAERERELAEARGNVMLSQIQPHFLYNTLTAIRELCQSDPEQAAQMIGRFSRYLRENMASLTSREPIAIERELRHVATYLELEQRRFGERLEVVWEVGSRSFACPPLVVQPVVENAVRHGVTKRVEGGQVRISTFEEEGANYVEVRDNGVGFDVARVLAGAQGTAEGARVLATGDHVGLCNVAIRLREVCGGTLSVTSVPGEGTCVRLRFPKRPCAAPGVQRHASAPGAPCGARGQKRASRVGQNDGEGDTHA